MAETVLHRETHDNDHTVIEVVQEHPGAGLNWRVQISGNGIIDDFKHQSGGRFYLDSPDEVIHGKTMDDVIATCAAAARRFLKIAA